jgi:hypothetical protein
MGSSVICGGWVSIVLLSSVPCLAKVIQPYIDTSSIIRGSLQDVQAMRDEIRRRGIDVHRMLGDLITNPVKQIDATPTHKPDRTGNGHDE